MALNTYGAVKFTDFGNPQTISMVVQSGAYSGGQVVGASGTPSNPFSLGLDSVAGNELYVQIGSLANVVGIALETASSGTDTVIPVATNGIFLLPAGGSCYAGRHVMEKGDGRGDDIQAVGSYDVLADATQTIVDYPLGKALNNACSGGFVLVKLGL